MYVGRLARLGLDRPPHDACVGCRTTVSYTLLTAVRLYCKRAPLCGVRCPCFACHRVSIPLARRARRRVAWRVAFASRCCFVAFKLSRLSGARRARDAAFLIPQHIYAIYTISISHASQRPGEDGGAARSHSSRTGLKKQKENKPSLRIKKMLVPSGVLGHRGQGPGSGDARLLLRTYSCSKVKIRLLLSYSCIPHYQGLMCVDGSPYF